MICVHAIITLTGVFICYKVEMDFFNELHCRVFVCFETIPGSCPIVKQRIIFMIISSVSLKNILVFDETEQKTQGTWGKRGIDPVAPCAWRKNPFMASSTEH